MATVLVTIPEHPLIRYKPDAETLEASFHRLVRDCLAAGLDWGDVEGWIEETWREETE